MTTVPFADVANVIDIAHAAGVDKVGLITAKIEAGQLESAGTHGCCTARSDPSVPSHRPRCTERPGYHVLGIGSFELAQIAIRDGKVLGFSGKGDL